MNLSKVKLSSGAWLPRYPFNPLASHFPDGIGDRSRCPGCDRLWDRESRLVSRGHDCNYLGFECGGGWWTAEVGGVEMWVGRCGKPLVQQTILFPEEEYA